MFELGTLVFFGVFMFCLTFMSIRFSILKLIISIVIFYGVVLSSFQNNLTRTDFLLSSSLGSVCAILFLFFLFYIEKQVNEENDEQC